MEHTPAGGHHISTRGEVGGKPRKGGVLSRKSQHGSAARVTLLQALRDERDSAARGFEENLRGASEKSSNNVLEGEENNKHFPGNTSGQGSAKLLSRTTLQKREGQRAWSEFAAVITFADEAKRWGEGRDPPWAK